MGRWLISEYELQFTLDLLSEAGIENKRVSASYEEFHKETSKISNKIIWNLSDGIDKFAGSLIPAFAALNKMPFFGSSCYVQSICQMKHHWKAVLRESGIKIVPGVSMRDGDVDTLYRSELRGPFFVKTATYGNNAGYAVADPMATDAIEATEKARLLLSHGLGPILIEEFASGIEYTVWCLHMKEWLFFAFEKINDEPYITNAKKDSIVGVNNTKTKMIESQRLVDLAREVVDVLKIKDFARIDFRTTAEGHVCPIDINTGAFLTGPSVATALETRSMTLADALRALLQSSYSRQVRL